MKHRIVIRCEGRSLRDFALKQQISKCITAALAHQGVNTPCEINVLVTRRRGHPRHQQRIPQDRQGDGCAVVSDV